VFVLVLARPLLVLVLVLVQCCTSHISDSDTFSLMCNGDVSDIAKF